MRLAHCCFTSFNLDIDWFKDWTNVKDSFVSYIILQGELTKDGRKHIQGYAQFLSRKRLSQIKVFFGDKTMHIEKTRGTPQQAADYCKKVKHGLFHSYEEYGTLNLMSQGQRTDLINLKQKIINGEKLTSIMMTTNDPNELRLISIHSKTLESLEAFISYERYKSSLLEIYKSTLKGFLIPT